MSLVIISYDVDRDHNVEMKKCLLEKGYEDIIVSDNKVNCNLPNTTLKKDGISANNGYDDMNNCSITIGANLERAIAIEVQQWKAQIGKPHNK